MLHILFVISMLGILTRACGVLTSSICPIPKCPVCLRDWSRLCRILSSYPTHEKAFITNHEGCARVICKQGFLDRGRGHLRSSLSTRRDHATLHRTIAQSVSWASLARRWSQLSENAWCTTWWRIVYNYVHSPTSNMVICLADHASLIYLKFWTIGFKTLRATYSSMWSI